MDQELIAFLTERFRETSQQIEGLREETAQQFAGLREETAQQFAGLREETGQQFAGLREETGQQFAGLREETAQQFAGLREETAQQFTEVREETAQQFARADRRVERVEHELHRTRIVVESLRGDIRLLAEGVMGVSDRLELFQSDVALKLDDVKASIVPYYQDLNRRVGILQERADRETRDIMDVIREKYGIKE
jgi:archaellum component FlaC